MEYSFLIRMDNEKKILCEQWRIISRIEYDYIENI